jgi:hypothetical protein
VLITQLTPDLALKDKFLENLKSNCTRIRVGFFPGCIKQNHVSRQIYSNNPDIMLTGFKLHDRRRRISFCNVPRYATTVSLVLNWHLEFNDTCSGMDVPDLAYIVGCDQFDSSDNWGYSAAHFYSIGLCSMANEQQRRPNDGIRYISMCSIVTNKQWIPEYQATP